ncbi:MAG: 50S ribosomal protein L10 [Gammaproteobacteria bacterium]|nr:50S ribosomal protein L10 [Gammaproteobacteria bacterium]MYF02854.1 50S ribosomal protein L10 [Gammaproteobacteria bacterium]MYI77644.1 50S ribosomal protein L10 [Gammaproteobacteria bacterium]
MPLAFHEKEAIVAATRDSAVNSVSTLLADYRGLSVQEATSLRKQAREQGVQLQVVRNTLARLALKDTDHECLVESIDGPTMLAFSPSDPGASARLFKDLLKTGTNIEVKAISVAGTLCSSEQLDAVASLPTREEALAQLMSVMLGPVTKLAQVLHAVPSKLVRTLDAIREQKPTGA